MFIQNNNLVHKDPVGISKSVIVQKMEQIECFFLFIKLFCKYINQLVNVHEQANQNFNSYNPIYWQPSLHPELCSHGTRIKSSYFAYLTFKLCNKFVTESYYELYVIQVLFRSVHCCSVNCYHLIGYLYTLVNIRMVL